MQSPFPPLSISNTVTACNRPCVKGTHQLLRCYYNGLPAVPRHPVMAVLYLTTASSVLPNAQRPEVPEGLARIVYEEAGDPGVISNT